MSFSRKNLVGLASGVLVGVFLGERAGIFRIAADGFVKLLQMTVLPYVTVSIISMMDIATRKLKSTMPGTMMSPTAPASAGRAMTRDATGAAHAAAGSAAGAGSGLASAAPPAPTTSTSRAAMPKRMTASGPGADPGAARRERAGASPHGTLRKRDATRR